MDFTALIVFGSIFLLISSISVFLFAFTYYNKSRFDVINSDKTIIYKGDTYEKK